MSNTVKVPDELLKDAINYAEYRKMVSVDTLMCKFHLGRDMACALMDVLESEGIVEAYDGNSIRKFISRGKDVFIDRGLRTEQEIRNRIEELEKQVADSYDDENVLINEVEAISKITALKWVLGEQP